MSAVGQDRHFTASGLAAITVQTSPSAGPPANVDPVSAPAQTSSTGGARLYETMTTNEFLLGLVALVFGVIVIGSGMRTLKNTGATAEQALRFYAVIVILIGTLLLILSGLDGQTVAPAMGLFGTIAGYILGKGQAGDEKPKKPISPQPGGAETGNDKTPDA